MEVFVIHIPHNSICSSDGEKQNTIELSHIVTKLRVTAVTMWEVVSQIATRTIVDHYSKLLQEKVDVGVKFHFSSFAKHDQHISSSIQVVLQYLQLKIRKERTVNIRRI